MTEEEFITSMRVLFRVWRGTENADTILTDVVATIGSQCFDKHGLELRQLEAECGSRARSSYQEYLVKQAKFWDGFFDSMLSPKRP